MVYESCAGTAYVTYDDVKVPIGQLLGKENKGFYCIVNNFNHERWFILCQLNGALRSILDENFKWTNQRIVFGKKLSSQPVIREKLANMTAQLESCSHWLDNIT